MLRKVSTKPGQAHIRRAQEEAAYGDDAVGRLAKALRIKENTLHAHAKVAKRLSLEEFKALTDRRGADGSYRLSWSHVVMLAAIKEPTKRASLADEACANSLSEKELRQVLRPAASPPPAPAPVVQAPDNLATAARALADQLYETRSARSRIMELLGDPGNLGKVEKEELAELKVQLEGMKEFARVLERQLSGQTSPPSASSIAEVGSLLS